MTLAEHLHALLDTPVRGVTDLGSSHAWTMHRAALADGRDVFVKAAAEPTTVFAAEASGLRWLAAGAHEPVGEAIENRVATIEARSAQFDLPRRPGGSQSSRSANTPDEIGSSPNEIGSSAGTSGLASVADQSWLPGVPTPGTSDTTGTVRSASVAAGSAMVRSATAGGESATVRSATAGGESARPGSVPDLLPEVLAADDRMIVLPWLDDTGPTPAAAEQLGRELAALHANSPNAFGAPWQGWIAELPLDNTLSTGPWARWYAERRLAPYLPRAAPHLGRDGIRLLEQVIDRIDTLAGPPEPPARIHGDLWSGNIRWTAERAILIDPAAHGGHRETDLAMLALFGAPHLDRILNAYNETHPLADGWRTRIPLHQLHHLLVHVVLFGATYRAQTLTAATTALAG
ncbi:fructosamine kinase family protein [Nocardia sp. NBC_01499]|uniref:fructosamine kinase family protein n=1 Tax=Nocardia sp. NBC_01499 TaxID=2903597 RepID=UPI00386BF721